MSDQRVYNFSAGPSMLPLSVLERAGAEITNYHGSGMSVMEMSHRSKVFIQIFEETQAKLRRLMKVPDNYKILFLQTGATGQFSMIPLNLIGKTGRADYAVTGNFSNLAAKEAAKFKSTVTVESGAKKGDAKKIMSLMMLGAKKEHTLSFTVEGEDEEACAAALEAFLKENL